MRLRGGSFARMRRGKTTAVVTSPAQRKAMTRGLDVECNRLDIDRYGRWVSECRTEQTVLNEQMVIQGHAVAYRRYSQAYVGAEEQARAEKRGIWAGRFEKPERWRRNNR